MMSRVKRRNSVLEGHTQHEGNPKAVKWSIIGIAVVLVAIVVIVILAN